jgi:manganese transport protein
VDEFSQGNSQRFDSSTIAAAERVLSREQLIGWHKKLVPFLGPAFMAAVAYVDPGNYATNIQSGAKFGCRLLWVVLAGNGIAMLVQLLSAKLGIATGKNLAELCREHFPRSVVRVMWVVMEIVAMATDLAEFLGTSIGLFLLFHIPLIWAGFLAVILNFAVLALQRYGFRPIEAAIAVLIGIVAGSYLIEIILIKPDLGPIVQGLIIPGLGEHEAIVLAVGILGATVMPHVIFLHSALTQNRIRTRGEKKLKRLYWFEFADVFIAMVIAGAVNAAMLIMAASTFYNSGMYEIGTIEEAHRTLTPLLGGASSTIFAVSLLASGISSSAVGTMSGQVVMQGFMHFHIPIWIRRVVTVTPSIIVIAVGLDPTTTLVISQVVLSFGLPFAIIPLVIFTRKEEVMGPLVNRPPTTFFAGLAAAMILVLNIYLIYSMVTGTG